MIGRADIEGSKSDVAMNAWPPQASYPCGVPPQSNSPPATVPGAGHARLGRALDTRSESPLGARLPASPDDEAFGYLKRVIVTPAVYPRFIEFLHFDIQSTGQKSHRPRRPARSPRERDPTGTVAGEIREKGPARVQSRRHRPPNPIPSTGPPSTRRQTPPPENLRNSDAVRHHRQRPREAGRAPRFQRRREAGDGMTAPPAAARAQPRFAPQPDRPSP
ncbi:hypothetical protein VZT92_012461 [Zoarces viviparus]|uniref:Uncharacterized protein n=1 Tax=Zoarces viviparus TaxID=48416 RepID=A0AAW1DWP7_ZOAVI